MRCDHGNDRASCSICLERVGRFPIFSAWAEIEESGIGDTFPAFELRAFLEILPLFNILKERLDDQAVRIAKRVAALKVQGMGDTDFEVAHTNGETTVNSRDYDRDTYDTCFPTRFLSLTDEQLDDALAELKKQLQLEKEEEARKARVAAEASAKATQTTVELEERKTLARLKAKYEPINF